jgi:4-amino-4-deoxy-L-arabinose transferase-like glycosyltransferase
VARVLTPTLGFAAAWCAVLAVCTILRPLQLDEVLQLIGTRVPHLASVFDWLRYSPGSVPIGYALQWALVGIAGFSNFIARLPSIAALFLTMFAMLRIGTLIGARRVEVLTFTTALTPMLFRYSIEGRPYLPAFCLTAFATLLLLRFVDDPVSPRLWRLGV